MAIFLTGYKVVLAFDASKSFVKQNFPLVCDRGLSIQSLQESGFRTSLKCAVCLDDKFFVSD